MGGVLTIFQKEWRQYFLSPVAYVILVVFIALSGFFFFDMFSYFVQTQAMSQAQMNPAMADQINVNDMVLTPLFHNLSVLLLLIVPVVTMRLYTEERRNGTDEMLLTSPVSEWAIILGKYLGALAFYALSLALTFQFPLLLAKYGHPDIGKVLTGYLGLFLMGSAFLAFGLFTSAAAGSQIQAALWSFAVLLGLWIVGWLAEGVTGTAGDVMRYIAMLPHFDSFAGGEIVLQDLVYFATFIAFFLFVATRVVESARWR